MRSRNNKKKQKDPLIGVKLATAKARLTKLEVELPAPEARAFTRYEDLPPLPVEDREAFEAELIKALDWDTPEYRKKKHDWYMSMAHFAP